MVCGYWRLFTFIIPASFQSNRMCDSRIWFWFLINETMISFLVVILLLLLVVFHPSVSIALYSEKSMGIQTNTQQTRGDRIKWFNFILKEILLYPVLNFAFVLAHKCGCSSPRFIFAINGLDSLIRWFATASYYFIHTHNVAVLSIFLYFDG